MSKIFCFCGAHGTGKSSILEKLKEESYPIKVIEGNSRKYIKDYEAQKDNEEFGNHAIQHLVAEDLYTKIYKEVISNKYAIFSRSPIDTLSYSMSNGLAPYMQELWKKRIEDLKEKIIYFYTPIEFDIEDDGIRGSNKEHQEKIDKMMSQNLNELVHSQNVWVVTGTIEERVEIVKKIIQRYL